MKKIIILLITILTTIPQVALLSQGASVYKVQAVYIYNFTKHVNWKSNEANFNIGVYGSSEVLTELQTILKGKVVGVKPIVVKSLTNTNEILACDIVYVSHDKNTEVAGIADKVKSKGILVIGEESEATKKGAAISFVLVNGKLKFKINQKSLQEAGLQVSDALLTLGIVE